MTNEKRPRMEMGFTIGAQEKMIESTISQFHVDTQA